MKVEPIKGVVYYMDGRLQKNLDKLKKQNLKKDFDCCLALDGEEGSGKSTLALQIGFYLDPSLNMDRICFSADEFRNAILNAEKGQCVIYDEGFTGLSSRASLSEVNRVLVSLMMQMRQKNLFVIIVLPTFYLLDKYVAIWRAKALIHTYFSSGLRGKFIIFNRKKKKLLYLMGRKEYSYSPKICRSNFRGRFLGGYIIDEDMYRKKKEIALSERGTQEKYSRFIEQRNVCIYIMHNILGVKQKDILNHLKENNVHFKKSNLSQILAKFKERPINV